MTLKDVVYYYSKKSSWPSLSINEALPDTKENPVMAKTELLPKDILVDLEQGDRTELFLEVMRDDERTGTLGEAFTHVNQFGQLAMSGAMIGGGLAQQLGALNHQAMRMNSIDPADPRNFQR